MDQFEQVFLYSSTREQSNKHLWGSRASRVWLWSYAKPIPDCFAAPGAPRLPTCFSDFKKKRNYVTYIMNMARREFFSKLITENSADQGRLFRATKKLLCETNELFSPDYHDRVALANDIGRFFVRNLKGFVVTLRHSQMILCWLIARSCLVTSSPLRKKMCKLTRSEIKQEVLPAWPDADIR